MKDRLDVHCPYCGFEDSKVTDSRTVDEAVRRRRECLRCEARFTTFERVEVPAVLVVKKDGRREEFSREKILSGVRRACEKRPLASGAMDALVERVQSSVYGLGQSEVQSTHIGELVMRGLHDLDQIAYVRFASVYRQFADLDQLREAVDEVQRSAGRSGRPKEQLPLIPDETLAVLAEPPRVVPLPPSRRGRRQLPQRAAKG